MAGVADNFDVDLQVDARVDLARMLWLARPDRASMQHAIEMLAHPRRDTTHPEVDAAAHPAGPDLLLARLHLYQVRRMLTGAHDQCAVSWPITDRVLGLLADLLNETIGLLGCWFTAGEVEALDEGGDHLVAAAELHGVRPGYAAVAEADRQADAMLAQAHLAVDVMWHAAGVMSRRRTSRARKPDPGLQALLVGELIRAMVAVIATVHHQYGRVEQWWQAAAALTRAHWAVQPPRRSDRPGGAVSPEPS